MHLLFFVPVALNRPGDTLQALNNVRVEVRWGFGPRHQTDGNLLRFRSGLASALRPNFDASAANFICHMVSANFHIEALFSSAPSLGFASIPLTRSLPKTSINLTR